MPTKVKYVASKANGEYPDLTDGKVYEVDSIDEIEGVNCYFIFDDESEGRKNEVEPYPYDVAMFVEA